MKKNFLILVSMLFAAILSLAAQVPAFPGAEGGGMYSWGGRGGKVIYVTSLDDTNTPGTLRWAIGQQGARTVLFKVSGIIQLTSNLIIANDSITIAGQTAPGDGICLRDYSIRVDAKNAVIRYLHFRLGDEAGQSADGIWGRNSKNVIIDHCSMSWSVDECSSFYSNENFTMQWCLLSESLNRSIHNKVEGVQIDHGYGAIWGGKNVTYHHNMLAHHLSRNPRFAGFNPANVPDDEIVDFRNNVLYNYGAIAAYGGENEGHYNMVANYYKYGPGTRSVAARQQIVRIDVAATENQIEGRLPHGVFYVADNYVYDYPAVTINNWTTAGVNLNGNDIAQCRALTPFATTPVVTQHTAEQAYAKVLDHVGASLVRDAIDSRVVQEAKTGTVTYYGSATGYAGLIDSQTDVGGWPAYNSLSAPADDNDDGIPNDWLENHYPDKTANDVNADGYTYLEVYLNSLVEDITQQQSELPVLGTSFSVFYPLSSTSTVLPIITGDVTASDESFVNAATSGYVNDIGIIWAPGDTLQSALSSVQGCGLPGNAVWPQETVLNPDRYIQFAVAPQTGTALVVDSIGLYVGGSGTSGIRFVVRTSTSPDFSTYTTLLDRSSTAIAGNYLYPAVSTAKQTITEDETLYIRVYFWQVGPDATRRFLIKNVMIKGTVIEEPALPALTSFTVGGINGIIDPSEETITLDIPSSNPIFENLSDVATYFTTEDDETTVTIGGAPVTTGDGIDYSNAGYGLENIPVVLTNTIGQVTYNLTIRKYIAFSVLYPLNQTTTVTPQITGNVTASDEVLSDWAVRDYQTAQGNPNFPDLVSSTDRVQRLWRTAPDTTTPGIAWPDNETGINPDRYIQFAVTPKTGTELTVDSIGLYLGGNGSGLIQMAARASTSFDFDAPEADTDTLLYSTSGNASNYLYPASSTKSRILAEGDTLYVRAYFWIDAAGQNRAVIIKNVTICGKVTELPAPPALTSFTVGGVNGTIDPSEQTITLDIPASNPIFANLSDVATFFTTLDDETTVTIGDAPATTGDGIDYSETGNGLENIPVVLTNGVGEITYNLTIRKYIGFSVLYPLNQTTTVKPTIEGNVTASDETFSDAEIQGYTTLDASITVVTNSDRIQRVQPPDGDNFPAETDVNPDRYVQFTVTPDVGYSLSIDSIGLYVGSGAGGSIGCSIRTSKSSDFSDYETLGGYLSGSMTGNLIYPVSSTEEKLVGEGETLYIRAYFWNSVANLKYFLIKNVMIAGKVTELPPPPSLTSFSVSGVNGSIDPSEQTITLDIPSSNPVFANLSNVATFFTTLDDETTVTIGGVQVTTGDGIDYSETGNGLENIPVVLTNNVGETTYALTIRKYTAFSVVYPLSSTTTVTPTITGKVTAADERFLNAAALDYASTASIILPSEEVIESALSSVQRCGLPDNAVWPQETELNADRYVEFAVSPKTGATLIVDSIGLYVGGATSGGIKFAVRTSTSPDFSTYNTIIERSGSTANVNGSVYPGSFTQKQTIADGETLYVRAYFWQTGTASTRRFLIKDVAIAGKVLSGDDDGGDPTGLITVVDNHADLVAVKYYNIQGIEVANPVEHHIYIVKKIYSDHTVKTEKIIKKTGL
ncbi:MAG: hypothetical protein LBN93_04410 [Candidatus Symbiothrix sp.]|jgi:hypothetical protein|nr:hypothetical protein [Candidatus Symbiothrix sp.]